MVRQMIRSGLFRGAWVAQSLKRLTSAQVMISRSVSSSPALGSVLTAQSLEPASYSVSSSLSAPSLLVLCLPLCLPHPTHTVSLSLKNKQAFKKHKRGTWVAQSVKRPTSAQIMTSRFMSLSPALGSVLTAQSLEPASDSVSSSLSAPSLLALCLSLSLSLKDKYTFKKFKIYISVV